MSRRNRGKRAAGRPVDGILLLDKPSGIRSNEALQQIKSMFGARKAGHTGSLDRLASGMLPICLGEATKISGFLLDSSKSYESRFRLGITTNTGDSDGEVRDTREVPALSVRQMRELERAFSGEIEQIPPMHSALKVNGQRLYELAYQGVEVKREARPVTIYNLSLELCAPDTIAAKVHCSKGTYIRTLAEDIGAKIGCGAHVVALRRTAVGPFEEDKMLSMEAIKLACEAGMQEADKLLLPSDAAVGGWPEIGLNEAMAQFVRNGHPVIVPRAPTAGWVRLYDPARQFVGVGEVLDDGRVAPRRLLQSAR